MAYARLCFCLFPSRYRAAFHFRQLLQFGHSTLAGFNLVIERLFISGQSGYRNGWVACQFQSRYRAAFHFRDKWSPAKGNFFSCFNLVIERLFISGIEPKYKLAPFFSFNLVIERLFISGEKAGLNGALATHCFNLVIERLFISG